MALLPGALYTWSFERVAGAWGVSLSDRVLRFIGVSSVFHALVAPITLWFWRDYVDASRWVEGSAELVVWGVTLGYIALPIAAGTSVGIGTRGRRSWAKIFTGPAPAPRAWDHLFSSRPDGWMRLRLKSGVWLGGAFADSQEGELGSYAAGYPDPQDLYLAASAEVDPDSGEFLLDEDGLPIMRDSGILIQWDQVEYLEFNDA